MSLFRYFVLALLITDEQRQGSRFYNRFLLSRLSEYYANIPWQKTGHGLGESLTVEIKRVTARFLKKNLHRILEMDSQPYNRGLTEYPKILSSSKVRDIFLAKDLMIDEFLDGAATKALSSYDFNLKSGAYALTGMLSFETYRSQVRYPCMDWKSRMHRS